MAQQPPNLVLGTNSYATLAEGNTYFDNRFAASVWFLMNDDQLTRALITASTQISQLVSTDNKLPITLPINQALKNATSELAFAMVVDAKVVSQSSTGKNIKRAKAGSAEVEFFRPTLGTGLSSRFPSLVMGILKEAGLIATSSDPIGGAFASGTDVTSQFDDCDVLTRNQGFSE